MTHFDKRVLEMFLRLTVFFQTYSERIQQSTTAAELKDIIIAAVEKLSNHSAEQTSGKTAVRVSSEARAKARREVVEHLERLSRSAKGKQISDFVMPRSRSDQAILATARSFAANAERFKQQFIDSQLPADFIERLTASVQTFERLLSNEVFGRHSRQAATKAIELTRTSAVSALQRLDPIIENMFSEDAVALTLWHSSRRLERYSARRSSKPDQATTRPIPPVPIETPTVTA